MVSLYFLMSHIVYGQHAGEQPTLHHEEIPHWKLGLSISHAFLPSGNHENLNEKLLIVPAIGAELFYNINHKWGIIWTNEVTMQSYVVNNEKEDNLKREFPVVSAIVANYHIGKRFYINAGPGIEIEKHKSFFIFRFGLEYELVISEGWDVAPAIHFETKEGKFGAFYLGVTIARHFGK